MTTLYTGDESDEPAKVAWMLMLFNQVRVRRVNFETQWEEAAALCWPEYRNTFYFGRDNSPGQKMTFYQVDSNAALASHRFGAITHSLMTPENMRWAKVEAGGTNAKYLKKDRGVREFFEELNCCLWDERYKCEANFIGQQQQNWQGLGVFGNMGMWVDELEYEFDPEKRGLRYRAMPVGECYIVQDHQGQPVTVIRHMRRTAQQAKSLWRDSERWPAPLEAALQIGSQQLFNFLHFVRPRTDWSPWEIYTPRSRRFTSTYLSVEGMCILEEGRGYRVFPMPFGRYMQAPDEDYGRGPAQMVLPELKTLNAEKADFLKQGHRAGDPAYLVPETGLIDLKLHGGATTAGGMTSDGKLLVGVVPTGNIQVSREMLNDSVAIVKDAFLVNLFQLLLADKDFQMGPRQVVEYMNERGIMLAPTVGRQASEYVGPLVYRELDILSFLGRLPKMPPALKEARGEYKMVVTSPLARAVQSQEAAGIMRTAEFAGQLVQMTGDPSIMDALEADEMLQVVGEANNSPERVFASPQRLKQKRDARQQSQERDRQVKELPGRAAMAKAQAITTKAATGGNTGGTLSGTPQGGMPMMPGQSQPGGRLFG